MASSIIPVQLTGVGNSTHISMPVKSSNSAVGLQLVVSGTGTYKVQVTMFDPQWTNRYVYQEAIYTTLLPTNVFDTDAQWVDHNTLINVSATQVGNLIVPCTAIRLVCTAYTSGYGALIVTPAAYPG